MILSVPSGMLIDIFKRSLNILKYWYSACLTHGFLIEETFFLLCRIALELVSCLSGWSGKTLCLQNGTVCISCGKSAQALVTCIHSPSFTWTWSQKTYFASQKTPTKSKSSTLAWPVYTGQGRASECYMAHQSSLPLKSSTMTKWIFPLISGV